MSKSIYVGNLPWSSTEEQVRANAAAIVRRFDADELALLDEIFPAPPKVALF